ncbi:MAG: diguanylate cyclase [Actinomycetota bacterium]|nr:diguanylate cyclase [Actinomycetota bacterium]
MTLQEGLVEQDQDARIVAVNAAARRLVGGGCEFLVGRTVEAAGPDGWSAMDRTGRPLGTSDFPSVRARACLERSEGVVGLLAPGRNIIWLTVVAVPLDAGGVLTSFVDVSELVRAHAVLERRASYDSLTGIANRSLILQRLAGALERQRGLGTDVAVAFADVDHLKAVNDELGHEAGDQLLCAVALRLRSALRPTDMVGRLGGDEFVVVMEEIHGVAQAVELVSRIQQAMQQPVVLGGTQRVPGVSIGLRVVRDPLDAHAALRDADAALYSAKSAGRSRYHLFEEVGRSRT